MGCWTSEGIFSNGTNCFQIVENSWNLLFLITILLHDWFSVVIPNCTCQICHHVPMFSSCIDSCKHDGAIDRDAFDAAWRPCLASAWRCMGNLVSYEKIVFVDVDDRPSVLSRLSRLVYRYLPQIRRKISCLWGCLIAFVTRFDRGTQYLHQIGEIFRRRICSVLLMLICCAA